MSSASSGLPTVQWGTHTISRMIMRHNPFKGPSHFSHLGVKRQPIGIQHFGEKTDRLFFAGKLDLVRERMKRLRDTGLLIGVCTHLPHVAEEIAAQDWDIDFY